MSPQDKPKSRAVVVPKSRIVTPEVSDVSSASEPVPPSTTSSSSVLAATPSMCVYCFDVLIQELLDHHRFPSVAAQRTPVVPPELGQWVRQATVMIECPLFITWDKQKKPSAGTTSTTTTESPPQFELRGCIGTLQPKPLTASTFQEYALTAGLRDRRFTKITWSEVSQLRVAVSLLVQFETCAAWDDWTVGVHGIIIRFSQHAATASTSGRSSMTVAPTEPEYSATYLPEVAYEQGWDQMAAIKSLIRKAGYRSAIDPPLLQRIHCTRYQSSKTRLTYTEYVQATMFDPVALVASSHGGSGDHHHHHGPHAPHWNTCTNL